MSGEYFAYEDPQLDIQTIRVFGYGHIRAGLFALRI